MVNPEDSAQGEDKGEEVPLVEVRSPSKAEEPASGANGDVDAEASTAAKKSTANEESFEGLSKEELEKFAKDPFWRRLRLIIFVAFWIVWLGMLAAVVIIIVVSPKCPPRPERKFWQKPFYRMQVRSFAPESMESDEPMKLGSIAGIQSKLGYLRQTLGFSNFMIDNLVQRQASGCIADFKSMDPRFGKMENLEALMKKGRKKGFAFLMDFDATQADASWSKEADAFFKDTTNFSNMLSRDGQPGWSGGRFKMPRSSCNSLNVNSAGVRTRLKEAMGFWLDRGISGFVLTNVAYLSPIKTTLTKSEPQASLKYLFSNDSVQFVKEMRKFIAEQASDRGKELALFVDVGDLGYQAPADKLLLYADAADAVVDTSLGQPLASSVEPNLAGVVDRIASSDEQQRQALASNWPYLRRQPDAGQTALCLTLPGVSVVYYGQELGMTHVTGVRLRSPAETSYLTNASESTDQSQTPMQWSGPSPSAGWLPNGTLSLNWTLRMEKREADIRLQNLERLSSAGHPQSPLQLVQNLLALIDTTESLQWGKLEVLDSTPDVIAFARAAERFSSVVVLVSRTAEARTVNLPDSYGASATLKVAHNVGDAEYSVGDSYSLDSLFVPGNSVLVFVSDDGEDADKGEK